MATRVRRSGSAQPRVEAGHWRPVAAPPDRAAPEVQSTRSRGGRDPRTVELGYRSPTEYGALSSNGLDVYAVRQVAGAWTCQCKGYAARQTCCHTLAALLPRCWHCNAAEAVHLYRNHYEPETPILLCERCAGEVR